MNPTTTSLFLLLLAPAAAGQDALPQVDVPVTESQAVREAIDASGFSGAMLVYNLQEDSYVAGYTEVIDEPFLPASTFKIFSSLVALETGVVPDADTVIPWDGVVRNRKELNRDMDLRTAFRVSALPHYQALVRKIGAQRMQQFLDEAGYGNRDTSGGVDRFWLDGGLRISVRQQVDFLVRLYHGELPFSSEVMATVREMMATQEENGHVVHAKTGWTILAESEHTGWWVGWVEQESQVHFFATVLRATDPGRTFGAARKTVTREVLALLGILALPRP